MIAKVPTADERRTYLGRLSPGAFAVNFNRQPFVIQHDLADHELFDLAALVELSQNLPSTSVEYNSGDLPVSRKSSLPMLRCSRCAFQALMVSASRW